MRLSLQWIKARFQFGLLPSYFKALTRSWQDYVWGESVIAITFTLWWILGNPPTRIVVIWLVLAMFVAGYYVWRAEHIRLTPKLEVTGIKYKSVPEVTIPGGNSIVKFFIQIAVKCFTGVTVEHCTAYLRRVLRWSDERGGWEETEMCEPQQLNWSRGGTLFPHMPLDIEPDIERRIDVFVIRSDDKLITPTVHPNPANAQSVFGAGGTFCFDITIRGKDCFPVDVYLKVGRGEQWDKPIVEIMSKPNVLT